MTFFEHYMEHCRDYRALLFDIDGTLACCGHAAPGAVELLNELHINRIPYMIITNDALHSVEEKRVRLAAAGLEVDSDVIISAGDVLADTVELNCWTGKKFFILGKLGNPCFAEKAGLDVTRNIDELDGCFGIINAEGRYDWHDHMQAVMNYFRRHPYAPFVVPNPDSYWPGRNGTVGVGAGGQARFIAGMLREMGVDISPIYLGKPYRPIYDCTMKRLRQKYSLPEDLDFGNVIMLGDSLASDIAGANNCGMVSALLLTGITNLQQAANAAAQYRPALIFDALK